MKKLFLILSFFFCNVFLIIAGNTNIIFHNERVITERSLKILYVVSSFPRLWETFVINQVTSFLDHGHDVSIFAFNKNDKTLVHADVLKYNLLDRTFYHELPVDFRSFDICFCQYGHVGLKFLDYKQKNHVEGKLITCFRSINEVNKVSARDEYAKLFSLGDYFLTTCEYIKEKLITLGCDDQKIALHRSGIYCDKFGFENRILNPGQEIQIVSVNRLAEMKGTQYAIRAIAQLIKKYPNIRYTIIGDGELKSDLEQLIVQLGIQDYVSMLGWWSQDQISNDLHKFHIFVHPSITCTSGWPEGCPKAIQEAMAVGLPVISTYHGRIPELITEFFRNH